eukprot:CAMPEP_0170466746 /NCGR_PEP_ID=MMETSP0123-20130129/10582_1 /TAXON_ID=182087 /ORGANISM="Favella ehrenbergii, Strain Fehren 1" /LENGTH=125 /DNA_ID=CAMNT_0010732935 /DNA_START=57 /DNA_END=434 /DNA_ORIENTATION=+
MSQAQANSYNATLKGKINGLEETCKALTEELNFYRDEIQTLRGEKGDLETKLAQKTADIRQNLADDVRRSEEEMRRNHATQKAENQKTQGAIAILKTEKTNLHQHLLDLKRRIAELELMIGEEQQ